MRQVIWLDIGDKEESRFKKRQNSETWREREKYIQEEKKKIKREGNWKSDKAEKTNWNQDGYLSKRWRRTPCSLTQTF